jgi:hypothetical protein
MLATPHATTGAVIGALIPNPLLVVPLAIGSHFVLDSIPHWQETLAPYIPTKKTYIRLPIDIVLAATLVWLMTRWQPSSSGTIWLGATVANVPDLDSVVVLIPKLKQGLIKKYWDWHCKIQRETSSMWGVLTQFVAIAIGLVVVYETR